MSVPPAPEGSRRHRARLAGEGLTMRDELLRAWADQVGRDLWARWRRRQLHLVETPNRERTLAAIATATPVITSERGAWPETTVRPSGCRLAGRIARRRAERGEGGNDAA